MRETDVQALREVGFDDVAIHDIVQVTALFNDYNRRFEVLGIDPEPCPRDLATPGRSDP